MASSKNVESQRSCCQLEKMEDREEKRQLGGVLYTNEGVRGGHGGHATSVSFYRCRRHLHDGHGEDATSGLFCRCRRHLHGGHGGECHFWVSLQMKPA